MQQSMGQPDQATKAASPGVATGTVATSAESLESVAGTDAFDEVSINLPTLPLVKATLCMLMSSSISLSRWLTQQ